MWRRIPIALVAACALLSSSCHTPSSICRDYLAAINGMLMRCDLPFTYTIVDPVTGDPGCDHVQRITAPHDILDDCIPWAETVDCATVDHTDPRRSFPASCDATHFASMH